MSIIISEFEETQRANGCYDAGFCSVWNRQVVVCNNAYDGNLSGTQLLSQITTLPEIEVWSDKSPKDKSPKPRDGSMKMTNYFNYENRAERPIVRVFRRSAGRGWDAHELHNNACGASSGVSSTSFGSYYINYQTGTKIPDYYFPGFDDTVNSLMGQVVSDARSQFDLLTEVAEIPSTLKGLLSIYKRLRNPISTFIKRRNKILRENDPASVKDLLADLWLEFRYSIMPMVYSVQDIIDQHNLINISYESFRAQRKIYAVCDDPDVDININVTIRATGRNKYDLSNRAVQTIGLNPFVTAWELVPLSFVIDWFFNVGEFILANTTPINGSSAFCYSVREQGSLVKSKTWPAESVPAQTYSPLPNVLTFPEEFLNPEVTHKVLMYNVNSYRREIFVPTDVSLSWTSDSLSLFRQLDSVALSFKLIKNALRRLS